MQLTGKEIAAAGIVYNYDPEKGIQQQGIDVRINNVYRLTGTGMIGKDVTMIPGRVQIKPQLPDNIEVEVFDLDPGYYEVDLVEGVDVPANATLHFKSRSSLIRSGAVVHSGQFDAGFNTEQAGCFLQVIRHIKIQRGARIAQAIVFSSNDVDNTYDGQFQNDKQRNVSAG